MDEAGFTFVGQERLALASGLNERTVRRALEALVRAGWLARTTRAGRGQAWKSHSHQATFPPGFKACPACGGNANQPHLTQAPDTAPGAFDVLPAEAPDTAPGALNVLPAEAPDFHDRSTGLSRPKHRALCPPNRESNSPCNPQEGELLQAAGIPDVPGLNRDAWAELIKHQGLRWAGISQSALRQAACDLASHGRGQLAEVLRLQAALHYRIYPARNVAGAGDAAGSPWPALQARGDAVGIKWRYPENDKQFAARVSEAERAAQQSPAA